MSNEEETLSRMPGRNSLPDLNPCRALLLDLCGLAITSTMFKHTVGLVLQPKLRRGLTHISGRGHWDTQQAPQRQGTRYEWDLPWDAEGFGHCWAVFAYTWASCLKWGSLGTLGFCSWAPVNGAWHWRADWCSVSSNADNVPDSFARSWRKTKLWIY